MRVLFVTLFPFEENTSVTISSYGLLCGFRDLGYDVTILEPHMNRTGDRTSDYDLDNFNIERIPGAYFSELRKETRQTIWRRILRKFHKELDFLDFTAPLLKLAKRVAIKDKYYDIILSVSDPKTSHIFVATLIKRGLRYGRWIQHWGDPLNGDITRRNCYPVRIIQLYERGIIKKADKVVYVSPFTTSMQQKAYPDLSQKIRFIPLPYLPFSEYNHDVSCRTTRLNLAYLGDYFSAYRNIIPLYNACKEDGNVELIIAGISDLKLESTENITIMPRMPQSQARQIEANSDVSVCLCNTHGTQIPGKLYYSAASQKHILVILDGEEKAALKEYLAGFGRYLTCDNTVQSIRQALKEISTLKDIVYDVPNMLSPRYIVENILN